MIITSRLLIGSFLVIAGFFGIGLWIGKFLRYADTKQRKSFAWLIIIVLIMGLSFVIKG